MMEDVLIQRARELARPVGADGPAATDIQVLRMIGMAGAWAVPVAAVARIEPLAEWVPLPNRGGAVLGLALLAGRRCLVVDPEAVLSAAPPRRPGRPGHAVLLRDHPLALAVDRADAVLWLPPPPGGHVLADGSLLMDVGRLLAAVKGGGAR